MATFLNAKNNRRERESAAQLYPGTPVDELSLNGFITVDKKWNVMYWNKGAEDLFKIKAGEIIGKNIWDRLYPVIPIDFYGAYGKIFQPGGPYQFSYYWAEISTWIDISTFSEMETYSIALQPHVAPGSQTAEKRSRLLYPIYRIMTEANYECLWNWKAGSGERCWIDAGLKRVFGYAIENIQLPLSFWENRIHPDDLPGVRSRINQMIRRKGGDWLLQYRFRKADGSYTPVHETGHRLYNRKDELEEVIGAMYDAGKKSAPGIETLLQQSPHQKAITAAFLTAQETERYDIGYKLNEDLNQILAVVKLYIQLSMSAPALRAGYLQKATGLIGQVIAGIRGITSEILIPDNKLISLFEGLENLFRHLEVTHSISVRFTHAGFQQEELGEEFQFAIFRIIQEQLRVIIAGKGAQLIRIDIRMKGQKIILLMSDDRRLIDLGMERNRNSFTNIQSRAGIFNGASSLYTTPDSSCTLKVIFPLKAGEQEKQVTLRNRF
ncbi:MAG: PAS domain-containing protein [Sphingobacteriales bacterium]|nr:PAS domain-containing protein [Sphingobacteriales bacterium]